MNCHKNVGEDPCRYMHAKGEKPRTWEKICMQLNAFFAPSPLKGLETTANNTCKHQQLPMMAAQALKMFINPCATPAA